MRDIEDEAEGMSSGSEEVEDAEVLPKGVAQASVTQADLTLDPEIDKEIGQDRNELKQRHESAAAEVVTPADLQTARHKEVWYLGLSWEHAKRRVVHLPPLNIKTPIEQQIWNRARDALKKKKEAMKKFNARAAKAGTKPCKKQKPEPAKQVVFVDDEDNEGHYQEGDYVASKDNYIKCSASAQELARLVHVMADESTQEALQQLVTGYENRQVIDDKMGRILPWKVFAELYNDAEFAPGNHFLDDDNSVERLREIDPSYVEREVDDKKLKGEAPNPPSPQPSFFLSC